MLFEKSFESFQDPFVYFNQVIDPHVYLSPAYDYYHFFVRVVGQESLLFGSLMAWSCFNLGLKLEPKETLLFKPSELILEEPVSGFPIIPPDLILNCDIANDFIKTNFVKKLKIQAAHEKYAHI